MTEVPYYVAEYVMPYGSKWIHLRRVTRPDVVEGQWRAVLGEKVLNVHCAWEEYRKDNAGQKQRTLFPLVNLIAMVREMIAKESVTA